MPRLKKYPNGYVQVTIVLDPEVKEEFDRRRGYMPRGDFVKWLLEVTKDLEPPWARKRADNGESHAKTRPDEEPKEAPGSQS